MKLIDLNEETNQALKVANFLDQIKSVCEMDHAAYCGMDPTRNSAFGAVTYSQDWKQFYSENNLIAQDATLHMAMRSIAPVDWKALDRFSGHRDVMNAATEFGIHGQGVTIPIRGPFGEIGLLSVNRDCSRDEWEKLLSHVLGNLHRFAVNLHDHIMSESTAIPKLREPLLSKREIEVLQWVACGKNQQDIGVILGISPRTVELHLRSCREKLNALTTTQAVARGITKSLIYPD
ncbi:MAG: autoinducer binding domain-containing protein [Pseudomonadota bacterium]